MNREKNNYAPREHKHFHDLGSGSRSTKEREKIQNDDCKAQHLYVLSHVTTSLLLQILIQNYNKYLRVEAK